MKILILCTKMPWPPKDGGAIATLNLVVGLASNGADVTLLTMNTGKHYTPPENIPIELKNLLKIRSVDIDTRIKPLKMIWNFLFSSYPYIARRFISRSFRNELQNCLDETRFDIVQIEGPYLGYYIKFIPEGPRLSLRAHNLEHRIWQLRAREEKNLVKRMYFRSLTSRIYKLEKKLLGEIDMLVPISGPDAVHFGHMRHDLPIHECPTGLEFDKYSSQVDPLPDPGLTPDAEPFQENKLNLFFIGALDWAPNQEGLTWFFQNVWPAILDRWPGMELHIAGRNSSAFFIGPPPPNVILEGEVDNAIDFYRAHNVMIVPLLSGSGIRIKILEAMAMGKLVICSSIAATGLGIENGKHLFIAESVEEYIDTLASLIEHPGQMKKIGDLASQFVTENFDNLVLSKKLISFYKAQLS
ncbi:glycosyltransferase family 4 protein [Bacteroidota bacterium]